MFYTILDFIQLSHKLVKLSQMSGSCLEQDCIGRKLYRLTIFFAFNSRRMLLAALHLHFFHWKQLLLLSMHQQVLYRFLCCHFCHRFRFLFPLTFRFPSCLGSSEQLGPLLHYQKLFFLLLFKDFISFSSALFLLCREISPLMKATIVIENFLDLL